MGGSGTGRPLDRWIGAGLALGLVLWPRALPGQPLPARGGGDQDRLERNWRELDRQIRALDALLPAQPEPSPGNVMGTSPLPETLLQPNAPLGTAPRTRRRRPRPPPLALPRGHKPAGRPDPGPEPRTDPCHRLSPTAPPCRPAARRWPRPSPNCRAGWAPTGRGSRPTPRAEPTRTAPASSLPPAQGASIFHPSSPFFIPPGGRASLNSNTHGVVAGLQLRYELLDFSRTRPSEPGRRAGLRSASQGYAKELRQLQLSRERELLPACSGPTRSCASARPRSTTTC